MADDSAYRVLVIIPAYNEQGKIGRVVSQAGKTGAAEVLVVDDCSTDGTAAEAKGAGATVLSHAVNAGVGAAIRSGIDFGLRGRFDVAVILSGDDQHDVADVPGLLRPIFSGGFDFVQGSRRIGGLHAPNIGLFRRVMTWIYAFLFRILTGFPCTDATNGGRAFRLSIFADSRINLWQDWLNTYELEPYLLYKVVCEGFNVTEAPMKIIYHDRGTTKMRAFRDWWRILRPMLYLALRIRS